MTRVTPAILAFALGVGAAIALASCGGGEAQLLPGTTAQEITKNLALVREQAAAGECVSAEDAAQQVATQVDELHGIDTRLKQALQAGAAKLNEVVFTCSEETTEESTEESPPTTTEATTTKPEKEKKPHKVKPATPAHPEIETTEAPEETTPSEPPFGEGKGHEETGEKAPPPSGGIGPGKATGASG